jgi:hypothetical protein
MNSARYSQVAARSLPREPTPNPSVKEAIIRLLDTETLVTEAIENLVRYEGDLQAHDSADALLGDAMRRIVQARSVLNDLRREKLGQPTIASSG